MAETASASQAGSNDKVMAAVATLPLVGLIMFYAMKDASPMVKHYAKQSNALLAIQIVSFLISTILGLVIPLVGSCPGMILGMIGFVAWIVLLVKALNEDQTYLLPVIGDYFDKLLK